MLPAKNILMGIAVICAVLFFLNVWRRTWLLPSVGLALLVLSAILLGLIWPGIVQQFQVKPSEAGQGGAVHREEHRRHPDGVRHRQDVEVQSYSGGTGATAADRQDVLDDTTSMPLVDPQLVRQAFEQNQQVRGYYSVADVLDVDRYDINGTDRALVLGVRELDQSGSPDDAQNWSNLHTVYTHGNGSSRRSPTSATATDDGAERHRQDPVGARASRPARTRCPRPSAATRPGSTSARTARTTPSSARLPGAPDVELDLGGGRRAAATPTTTTTARAASRSAARSASCSTPIKFGDPNFLLSERVNANSEVLYNRDPRERVQKVAPWLTLDDDPYPAVVDGRIVWIVDGYTTTDRYPRREQESFKTMTDDSLQADNGLRDRCRPTRSTTCATR